MAEEKAGGQSYNTQVHCLPSGMPRMMTAYQPMETLITPEITTSISFHELRRVYTDGRDWPEHEADLSATNRPVGQRERHLRHARGRDFRASGPRILDPTGIPLHKEPDHRQERFSLDKADPIPCVTKSSPSITLDPPLTVTKSYHGSTIRPGSRTLRRGSTCMSHRQGFYFRAPIATSCRPSRTRHRRTCEISAGPRVCEATYSRTANSPSLAL